jgi:tetraacyldisaccharide 4'-kinase
MTSLRHKAARTMMRGDPRDPAFSSPLEWLLYAASRVYGLLMRLRAILYHRGFFKQKRLPCKVISIGNITVGGTGKTPMVHYVANLLKRLKQNVAVISRGYGGSAQGAGGVVSDGSSLLMDVRASGDEPQLLGRRLKGVPVLVGKDRHETGNRAIERFKPSVLVMDDGFQHLPLKRDLDLLLLDSVRPFGNGHCLPRGVLRERQEQVKRADALILTRWTKDRKADVGLETLKSGLPVFRCSHVPDSLFRADGGETIELDYLKGQRLFLFSGIVRNDSFQETVLKLGGVIAGVSEFGDHHRYTHGDLELIWNKAKRLKAKSILTTEKDYANIPSDVPVIPELLVLGVSISFGRDTQAFETYIRRWVAE